MRVSYNGNTSAFQADARGSIPLTRLEKYPDIMSGYFSIEKVIYERRRQVQKGFRFFLFPYI